jgi:hypothetical protein
MALILEGIMATHWTDRRASVALVGGELARRGWKLCGWKEDRSDAMTDYYDPEAWDGVATHLERPGVVVCVNVSEHTMKNSSGGRKRTSYEPGETCPRCQGGQADPDGWSLSKAQADPRAYHAARLEGSGARALMPDVLSPLHFIGHHSHPECFPYEPDMIGRERCRTCSGRGHMLRPVESIEPWPVFQANPGRSTWHVERDGQIIGQGTGVYSIESKYDRETGFPKLHALVDRIERVADGLGDHGGWLGGVASIPEDHGDPGTGRSGDAADFEGPQGARVKPGTRAGFVEIHFDSKPPEDIRAELKGAGFRWAKGSGCWYGLADRLPARYGKAPGVQSWHAPDIDLANGY